MRADSSSKLSRCYQRPTEVGGHSSAQLDDCATFETSSTTFNEKEILDDFKCTEEPGVSKRDRVRHLYGDTAQLPTVLRLPPSRGKRPPLEKLRKPRRLLANLELPNSDVRKFFVVRGNPSSYLEQITSDTVAIPARPVAAASRPYGMSVLAIIAAETRAHLSNTITIASDKLEEYLRYSKSIVPTDI